mmetsp:Transcript_70418/g.111313  ORF Transcript_70418/g.111313 Transcript_70418/m.111313 type:complete len:292 (+) Transcript_70418:617-1492(+)
MMYTSEDHLTNDIMHSNILSIEKVKFRCLSFDLYGAFDSIIINGEHPKGITEVVTYDSVKPTTTATPTLAPIADNGDIFDDFTGEGNMAGLSDLGIPSSEAQALLDAVGGDSDEKKLLLSQLLMGEDLQKQMDEEDWQEQDATPEEPTSGSSSSSSSTAPAPGSSSSSSSSSSSTTLAPEPPTDTIDIAALESALSLYTEGVFIYDAGSKTPCAKINYVNGNYRTECRRPGHDPKKCTLYITESKGSNSARLAAIYHWASRGVGIDEYEHRLVAHDIKVNEFCMVCKAPQK